MPCIPRAEPPPGLPESPSSHFSIIDTGRVLPNAPIGDSFGLGDAGDVLSSLDLLEPDLGVMFEFKTALTGVATSSFITPFGVLPPA